LWQNNSKLARHYRKNQFFFWKAVETYGLGIYFIVRVNVFEQEPPPLHRIGYSILQIVDDPSFIFLLAVVGTMALTYSIWDYHFFRARQIMIGLLVFVWSIYFGAFFVHGINTGMWDFALFLIGPMILNIVSYGLSGDA
jgi:membrane-bound ClpP family serine protease